MNACAILLASIHQATLILGTMIGSASVEQIQDQTRFLDNEKRLYALRCGDDE